MSDTQRPPAEWELGDIPDPHVLEASALKAFGHPVRLRILTTLGLRGPLNIKQTAAAIGEPANSVSYHMGQLATHGLVVPAPAPEGASGRERWWQTASPSGFQFRPADVPDAAAAAGIRTWLQDIFVDSVERMMAGEAASRDLGLPLGNATLGAWLTVEEAREAERLLNEALLFVARRFFAQRQQGILATGPGDGEHYYMRMDAMFYPDVSGQLDARVMTDEGRGPRLVSPDPDPAPEADTGRWDGPR